MKNPTRRDALKGVSAGLFGTLGAPQMVLAADTAAPKASVRFTHGVASGDPLSDRVILWTRAVPFDEQGEEQTSPVEVQWEVSKTQDFDTLVASGTAFTNLARDFTLQVDATGLEPGTTYYYRFKNGETTSALGRTRTLPGAGLREVKLAVCSCSNYPAGYFNAYRAMAERNDIEAVLHLGDYIYEYGAGEYATKFGEGVNRIPDPPHETVTLEDYRRRYKQYRSDIDLQALHAAHPMIAIWDDHETANNSWKGGAQNHQPDTEGSWEYRRDAACQAYFEYLPIRRKSEKGQPLTLNRSFEFSDLVTLIMLETRLEARSEQLGYADDLPQAPYDTSINPPVKITDQARLAELDPENLPDGVLMMPDVEAVAEVLNDPNRELLGTRQLKTVEAAFKASADRNIPWQVLGNQVLLASINSPNLAKLLTQAQREELVARTPWVGGILEMSALGLPMTLDSWDGYPAARERLFDIVRAHGKNLIAVTGDTHAFWANEVYDKSGTLMGAEFGTTAISSPSVANFLNAEGFDIGQATASANKNVLVNDVNHRGYLLMTFTPDHADAEFMAVDQVTSPSFEVLRTGHFRVEASDGSANPIKRL